MSPSVESRNIFNLLTRIAQNVYSPFRFSQSTLQVIPLIDPLKARHDLISNVFNVRRERESERDRKRESEGKEISSVLVTPTNHPRGF